MAIKLSILDQSPISEGSNARETLQQTAQLARKAEEWGYTRFWVSEHHDTTKACRFIARNSHLRLASVTSTIRVGSGGVMLPHYSAYKLAENLSY